MQDSNEYARLLSVTWPLREPLVRAAIASLALPVGAHGVDAGCGIGLCLPLLAEAVFAAILKATGDQEQGES